MKFVDSAKISVKAGDGGRGCVSFRREKFVPKGGPDGGDGGRGGHVYLRANRQLSTLLDFKYRKSYIAGRGEHGMGARKSGKNGNDVVIGVPCGTVVRNAETGEVLCDMVEDGQEIMIAKGGRGGQGNQHFATATRQAPRFAQPGEKGDEIELEMELKLMADVGLVGFPNAGKSTLISVFSAARPKIADYPFTTLVPNLGIVRYDDYKSFVMADIPGIIEGAAEGRGLGIQFLRHIQRTKTLLVMVPSDSADIAAEYATLLRELEKFDASLLSKPRLAVITKMDIAPEDFAIPELEPGIKVIAISSVAGQGLKALKDELWRQISTSTQITVDDAGN
ncbi:GTP-binding protein Obg/CgtA [Chlorobaculum parvum NCIB 8327]|uniref:GTPase Obg n=1 Tax=Chlorobaculum parvum (strain DSM 263 / NCIMB 8327) TaxID=517417 RepID=OBG_CHLP8|nr:GTPase ObgE [Chlorobaculum parvum]B3QRD8.1 RecName: Full=GTPase Obg; AltName: Full=GTP-binding protein Obg [Chlorobaculum parvum NCIB 8327]ACF10582.1 GTP-binding protein Obg/CgtA [Chlorobaculum parvum NCIB 8327]